MHGDSLIFLIFIAAAGLLRLLSNITRRSRENGDTEPPPPGHAPPKRDETEEERIRKFLEALGQPAGTKPPTLTHRRTVTAPVRKVIDAEANMRRMVAGGLPPLTTAPPPLPEPEQRKRVFVPGTPVPQAVKKIARTQSPATIDIPQPSAFDVRDDVQQPPPDPPMVERSSITEIYRNLTAPPAAAPIQRVDLRELLRSPNDLRNAILLREILGAPRAFEEQS